jgi:hypothetical protein
MAAVYVSNLIINSGADFQQTFNLDDSDTNSPLNLTNYTISSQMRKYSGSSSSVSFASSITSPPTNGQISISLGSTQTSAIKPGRYVYDVLIIDSSSIKTRVVEGMVLVREGVTK